MQLVSADPPGAWGERLMVGRFPSAYRADMNLFRFDSFDEICMRLSDAAELARSRPQIPAAEQSRIDDFLMGIEDAQWRIAGLLRSVPSFDRNREHGR